MALGEHQARRQERADEDVTARAEVWAKRLSWVGGLFVAALTVGVPYGVDRAYRRWQRGISPLAGMRRRMARMRYHAKRRRQRYKDVRDVVRRVIGPP